MQIRNVAIIAHVDHGKTTLVDKMLRQAGAFRENQVVEERVMDSNPLERERGITILAKNTSVRWHGTKINIVDTPGHADFGGEVERILRMVHGVLLVVDAFDGPMPQTRFVLRKALALGRTPIVVINKIDRPGADPLRVHDEVLDLFIELEADEAQLDAPVVYASAREGVATMDLDVPATDLDAAVRGDRRARAAADRQRGRAVPDARVDDRPFALSRAAGDRPDRTGHGARGRPGGAAPAGSHAAVGALPGHEALHIRRTGARRGTVGRGGGDRGAGGAGGGGDRAHADGPGARGASGGDRGRGADDLGRFPGEQFPIRGRDGKFVTSRQVRERLYRELERNVALRVADTDSTDTWTVSGRGELHLSILMETMRREGYEFQVSRPRVITKRGAGGERLEPYEELSIDVPEEFLGAVIEKLGGRRAEMLEMKNPGQGLVRLLYRIPARGLFGYRSEFLTDTRGTGILHHRFLEYGPWAGALAGRSRGTLVSMEGGTVVAFALANLSERGTLFVAPGTLVYEGMIIGESARPGGHGRQSHEGKEADEHAVQGHGR